MTPRQVPRTPRSGLPGRPASGSPAPAATLPPAATCAPSPATSTSRPTSGRSTWRGSCRPSCGSPCACSRSAPSGSAACRCSSSSSPTPARSRSAACPSLAGPRRPRLPDRHPRGPLLRAAVGTHRARVQPGRGAHVNAVYGLTAIVLVCLVTLGVGAFGLRLSRTTSDFYVAGRAVTPYRNASAIGGEYLSAASFLGIAGLVYSSGFDMLWFPVGYTVGYVVLLVLVAAPLRRSGAYTLPDFAEARLESTRIRLLSSVLVVGIGWLYLLPQLQGAGLALQVVTGAPRGSAASSWSSWSSPTSRPEACARSRSCRRCSTGSSSPPSRSRRSSCSVCGWLTPPRPRDRGRDGRALGGAAQRVRRSGPPGLRDLQHHARARPRHHGPAARAGPLLHQPRWPGRAADDPDGRRAPRHLLPLPAGLRRPGTRLPPELPEGLRPDSIVLASRPPSCRGPWAKCSPPCSPEEPSPPSSRPRRD